MIIGRFGRKHKGNSAWMLVVVVLLPMLAVSATVGLLVDWGTAATVFFGLMSMLEGLRQWRRALGEGASEGL